MANNKLEIKVEMDIFSGRENPKWNLTGKDASKLQAMIKGIPKSDYLCQPEASLGYRGFMMTKLKGAKKFPSEIKVYSAYVTITKNGKTTYYTDSNNIESWLLKQAEEKGYRT